MKNRASDRADGWLAAAFERIDPARRDPAYWTRFRAAVLARALPELIVSDVEGETIPATLGPGRPNGSAALFASEAF